MKKSLDLLYELITLRKTNYDLFMIRFYELVTEDFSKITQSELFTPYETKLVLESMIKHFESKEEYEKCDVLLHLVNYMKS